MNNVREGGGGQNSLVNIIRGDISKGGGCPTLGHQVSKTWISPCLVPRLFFFSSPSNGLGTRQDQYKMCETIQMMSETSSVRRECIEPDGDLDSEEVFTYTLSRVFSVIHVQIRYIVISSYGQTTDTETIKVCNIRMLTNI